MDHHQFGGGSWSMIPNVPTSNLNNSASSSSSSSIPSNQDSLFLNPHQFHVPQQHHQQFHPSQNQFLHQSQSPQQQFIQQSPQQQQQQQQQFIQQSPQQQQFIQQSPQQQQFIQQSLSPQQQQYIQQPNQLQQQQQQQPQQQKFQQQQQQQNDPHQSLASHFHLLPLVEKLAGATESGTRDQHADSLINDLNAQFDKCQQLLNSISGSINTKAVTVEGQKHKLEESKQLLSQRRDLVSKYKSSVEALIKSGP
ncbi:hypothetical protein Ancab_009284 [Ancistrocladus abbreviatus]